MWEEVVRRRDRCDSASWDQLLTSISNHEMRQRLKKAPCFGSAQPRLGQGTATHRHARQTVTRDGEDLSFEWETAKTKRRSRSFVVLLLISRSKNFTSLASLLKVQTTPAAIPNLTFSKPFLAFPTKSPILHLTPLRLPTIIIPRILLRPLSALEPRNAIFRKRLNLRLQGRPMQRQVVHLANPHDHLTGPAGGD